MFNNSVQYLEKLFADQRFTEQQLAEPRFADQSQDSGRENELLPLPGEAVIFEDDVRKQGRVDSLIYAFRDVGFLYARLNPLGDDYEEHYTNLPLIKSGIFEKLVIEDFNLGSKDLENSFYGGPAFNHEKRTLKEILEVYSGLYCTSTGYEFLHIQNKQIRKWFIQYIEKDRNKPRLTQDEKKTILEDLIRSTEFEHFLNKTYIGQKRFSIEGAESVIPCLHFLVHSALSLKASEVVIGTTHRGRLTILNLILQLLPEEIFYLFEENYDPKTAEAGGGDVKYHIGYSAEHKHPDGTNIRITLPPNSSHLESVDAVVQGRTRGIQDRIGDHEKKSVIPVLLHGEAAFSGQGVAAETLNLSELEGYSTGGTIHILVNNQVGFTTSTRSEHSSGFATDIAKSVSIPVVHVNGDDPAACVRAIKLAVEYRQTFKKDFVIDLICYRKYGHNEGDDPSFTHPRMYEIIKKHKGVAEIYGDYCVQNGILSPAEQEEVRNGYVADLKKSFDKLHGEKKYTGTGGYLPHKVKYFDENLLLKNDVGVSEETLLKIADSLHAVPQGFQIHEKLERILTARMLAFKSQGTIDWSFAESLAFGSLLLEGHGVRLSGEDSERGTFSQRHLVWWDHNADSPKFHIPLNHLDPEGHQAELSVYDSPLSEYSVLGFEFGYSISRPESLVLWEAQYGDFVNGAQVIIDNYIIAAEAKWNLRSGLVLLLPHGYEGQGPEHSNAHLGRFLQLSAQENIQVCNVTTPAQYFCLLRRQVKQNVEKPLVIMAPKSLLRHPLAVSNLDDLKKGHFQFVIDDPAMELEKVSKVLFCTGKIYYDLLTKRNDLKAKGAALVRIEQLYPFSHEALEKVMDKYKNVKEKYWVQEEPRNRGAWTFIQYQFENIFQVRLQYIGRPAGASPATGSLSLHKKEQEDILTQALTGK